MIPITLVQPVTIWVVAKFRFPKYEEYLDPVMPRLEPVLGVVQCPVNRLCDGFQLFPIIKRRYWEE